MLPNVVSMSILVSGFDVPKDFNFLITFWLVISFAYLLVLEPLGTFLTSTETSFMTSTDSNFGFDSLVWHPIKKDKNIK